jgi:hypothetical protein
MPAPCSSRAVLHGAAVRLHPDDAAEALPLREQVEPAVDLVEAHLVRDELVQLQLLAQKSDIDRRGRSNQIMA